MDRKFSNIMVDLETTGTQPENTNIIQIAAARFDLETQEVDPEFFDGCLMLRPTRFWDEDTRRWWSSMPEILSGIQARMKAPDKVLRQFSDWANEGQVGSPTLWAKPTSFEFPFLQSYFRELGVLNPFHFRDCKDLNSWIHARYFPEAAPRVEQELEFVGDAHNALHDVLHQIKVLFHVYDQTSR